MHTIFESISGAPYVATYIITFYKTTVCIYLVYMCVCVHTCMQYDTCTHT